jgi:hypothetical protein
VRDRRRLDGQATGGRPGRGRRQDRRHFGSRSRVRIPCVVACCVAVIHVRIHPSGVFLLGGPRWMRPQAWSRSNDSTEENRQADMAGTSANVATPPRRCPAGEQLPPKACNLGVRQIDQTFRGLTNANGDHLRSEYKRGSRHGARPSKGKSYQAGSGY